MWLFTKTGFYSVVKHDTIADTLLVRSRVRADLDRLADRLGTDPGDIREVPPPGDYRWQMPVAKTSLADVIADEVENIDYTTSVKTAIDLGEQDRHNALMRVWVAMMTLQTGHDWGGHFNVDDVDDVDDDPWLD